MPIEYTIILSIVTAGIALMGVATGRTTLRRLQQQDNKQKVQAWRLSKRN